MSLAMPSMSTGSNSSTRGLTDNSNDNMGMMQMNFYWSKDAVILFSGWPGHRLGMYILALLFVFVLAAAVEVLSALPHIKLGSSHVMGRKGHAVVYTLRMGLAYLVMLSIMSFNFGIFISAVAGHGIGFFVVKSRSLAAADLTTSPTSPDTVKV